MPERTQPGRESRPDDKNPGPSAGSAVRDDLQSLQDRALVAEKKRDECLDLLQRSRADFENYQKRIKRDLEEERRYAHLPFARELLPVLDNLQRALGADKREGNLGSLVQGVAMVESQFLDVLRRFGVTLIDSLGRPFDPMLHEAVVQEPRTDAEPGSVVRILEPGYRLHERVLRPARVVVAAPPEH